MFLDFDECTDPVTHPCRNNSMCENSEGSFECPCVDGYEPATSGDSCEGSVILHYFRKQIFILI